MLTHLALWMILLPSAQPKNEPSPEPPPEGPITATLIAKNTTVKLDLKGMKADDFKKSAEAGKLAAQQVDWTLELRNTTKTELYVRLTPTILRPVFEVTGKGAAESPAVQRTTGAFVASTYVHIKPGKTYSLPIKYLVSHATLVKGTKGTYQEKRHYWTKAGDYKVKVSLNLIYREQLNVTVGKGAIRYKTLSATTDPVTIKVTEK